MTDQTKYYQLCSLKFILCFFASFFTLTSGANSGKAYEQSIIEITTHIQKGNFDQAESIAKKLHNDKSGARLASLLYADILAAQAGGLSRIGELAPKHKELSNLTHELNVRWKRHKGHILLNDKVPASLLQLSESTEHVVYADLSTSRLYVYKNQNGHPHLIHDYYVTQGLKGALKQVEGDQRTPVGVYYITGYIAGSTLPSRYGPGALPINYPNAFDKQLQRTGYGIWIHGTEPFLFNRSPYASDGCLSLNNNDFKHFNRLIKQKRFTPVIIERSIKWTNSNSQKSRKTEINSLLEQWSMAIATNNTEQLTSLYVDPPSHIEEPHHPAASHIVSRNTKNRQLEIHDLEIFQYPGEDDLIAIEFEHRDVTATFRSRRIQQFWKKNISGNWQITLQNVSPKNEMLTVANNN